MDFYTRAFEYYSQFQNNPYSQLARQLSQKPISNNEKQFGPYGKLLDADQKINPQDYEKTPPIKMLPAEPLNEDEAMDKRIQGTPEDENEDSKPKFASIEGDLINPWTFSNPTPTPEPTDETANKIPDEKIPEPKNELKELIGEQFGQPKKGTSKRTVIVQYPDGSKKIFDSYNTLSSELKISTNKLSKELKYLSKYGDSVNHGGLIITLIPTKLNVPNVIRVTKPRAMNTR